MKNASRRRRDKLLKIDLAQPLRGILRGSKQHLEAMRQRCVEGLPLSVPGDCADTLNSGEPYVDGSLVMDDTDE